MSGDTNVAVELSADYKQFMKMLEEGKHLEPFPEETLPPGETKESLKERVLAISNKFPFREVI